MLSELYCENCGYKKYSFERFGELMLEIDLEAGGGAGKGGKIVDVGELVRDCFFTEEIEDFYCGECKEKGTVQKTNMVWRFPKTLFLNLNRFVWYPFPRKVKQRVSFKNFDMDLGQFRQDVVDLESLHKGFDGGKGVYRVKGWVKHKGGMDAGHYTADVRSEGEWWGIDDDKVGKIDLLEWERGIEMGSEEVYVVGLELI